MILEEKQASISHEAGIMLKASLTSWFIYIIYGESMSGSFQIASLGPISSPWSSYSPSVLNFQIPQVEPDEQQPYDKFRKINTLAHACCVAHNMSGLKENTMWVFMTWAWVRGCWRSVTSRGPPCAEMRSNRPAFAKWADFSCLTLTHAPSFPYLLLTALQEYVGVFPGHRLGSCWVHFIPMIKNGCACCQGNCYTRGQFVPCGWQAPYTENIKDNSTWERDTQYLYNCQHL